MSDPLQQLARHTSQKAAIQNDWVAAILAAVNAGHTLDAVAKSAGVSRQRIGQIAGPNGRPRGRRPSVTTASPSSLVNSR